MLESAEIQEHPAQVIRRRDLPPSPTGSAHSYLRQPAPLHQDFIPYVPSACLSLGINMYHCPPAPVGMLILER